MTYRHYWIGSLHAMMNPLLQNYTPDGGIDEAISEMFRSQENLQNLLGHFS